MTRLVRDLRRRDEGTATIEVVGGLVAVALAVVCIMQFVWYVVAADAAAQAARDGARALSLGRPVQQAVERSLPGTLDARVTYPAHDTVKVTLDVRRVAGFPQIQVDRQVAMPRTGR
ncbi:hypothetical protein J1G43_07115 [Cellulomonas sp. zg-ZUI22]|uniref:hypothetical protein n=1 Tax=Cellulomonas sp. zg-ZUI22 TaxID=2816955 RepID=UPI001A951DE9|nr:hypothetical protein [Cellulomonas sp. zg-ZUI22]MBO0899732.1 hypothetical protein [Cellulomonas sp. zg-ZUI22]